MTPSLRLAAALVAAFGLVVGVVPLLGGAPAGDDAYFHAIRAQQHARCWLLGEAWPRWYPDLNEGIGGPEPRAYPLWPLLAQGALALVLGDGIAATSVATAVIPVVAGLVMLVVARRRGAATGPSVVLAAAWAATPYLVIAVHERSALAEGWGLAILPWVLDSLLPPSPVGGRGIARAAVAFAVLLAVQLPLALMVVVLVAGGHLAARRGKAAQGASWAGLLGLGLGALSWLPNVVSLRRLSGEALVAGAYGWREHLLPGGVAADAVLGLNLSLALAGMVAAGGVLAVAGGRASRCLAGGALASALLTTPLAGWVHGVVPGLGLLQFPWRWLGPASALVVLAAAASERRRIRALALALLTFPVVAAAPWRWRLPAGPALDPHDPLPVSAQAVRRYGLPPVLLSLPGYVPRGTNLVEAMADARRLAAVVGDGAVAGPPEWRFTVESAVTRWQEFPLLADAGWRVRLDGRPVRWHERAGLVAVALPAGRHEVFFRQRVLPEDLVGAMSSALALALLFVLRRGSSGVGRWRRATTQPRRTRISQDSPVRGVP